MKMCYRGVHYDYRPVFLNLNEQQKYFIDHRLGSSQIIQTNSDKICLNKVISLSANESNTKFIDKKHLKEIDI